MKQAKILFGFILFSSWNDIKVFIVLCLLLVKSSIIVRYVPLKFYFKKFFIVSNYDSFDIQLFQSELSLIRKIKKYSPIKVTCLIESMMFHFYLRGKGQFVPITLGVSRKEPFTTHAWVGDNINPNEFQKFQQ